MPASNPILLMLLIACNGAAACQHIVQTSIAFEAGSSELDRRQLVDLALWIGEATSRYPKFAYAAIESGAVVQPAERSLERAQERADQRAANVAQALKGIFPVDIQVQTTAHPYRKQMTLGSKNDFAVVQLYPDQRAYPLPDCNPVPLPKVPSAR